MKNLKKFTSLMMAMVMSVSCMAFTASAVEDEDVADDAEKNVALIDDTTSEAPLDVDTVTDVRNMDMDVPLTPTGTISNEGINTAVIDGLVVLKGSCMFHETGVGAYYYAFSGYNNTYQEAFANIKLPTSFNNASNTRNGYIALGIYGSKHGIDLGLKNDGNGWYPCSYDVGNTFRDFASYRAPSTATNAIITVNPVSTTSVHMYVQFKNANGANVGTTFNQTIPVASNNLVSSGGKIQCRFYRFASLVPKGTDNQKDSSYMLGGKFSIVKLYNRGTSAYDTWGISTARVQNAWLNSPERISVSYTASSDTFKIDHWNG